MKQFSRFIMVGVFNTLFGYCVIFACMYLARMSPEASNMTGYTIGLIVSYILNRNFTFNSKQSRTTEIIRFLAVFVVAYSSNFAILVILIHKVGLHEGMSQIFAGVVYVVTSYLMNKYYVFKPADAYMCERMAPDYVRSENQKSPLYTNSSLGNLEISSIINKATLSASKVAYLNSRSIVSRKEYIIALTVIISLFLILFGPALQAKFYIVEDHLLLEGKSRSILDWVTHIKNDIQLFTRFRPAYWIYIAVGNIFFGTNPHLWHAAAILWGVLTCYLLYIALRRLGADVASSFIFVLLLLSGTQNWIWLNLIPQETIGMLLSAIAVWAIVFASQRKHAGQWGILALIAMALAGLVKESFVILIPALLILRWTCQKLLINGQSWRETLHSLRGWITAGTLIFMIEMLMIMTVLLSKPGGYSAGASNLSSASFDPRQWMSLVSTLELSKPLALASAVWVGLWFSKEFNRKCLPAIAVIFAAWLIPQMVLYTNGIYERYLFPAIVSVAAAIALGLSILLRRWYLWPLWVIGMLLILPILIDGIRSTSTTVGSFTAETQATDRMIEFLVQNVPADQTILMAGDSGTPYGFEATYSLPLYLKLAGSKSPFFLWPLLSKGERSVMHIAASNNNSAFRYPDSLTLHDIGAIIIVDTFTPGLNYKPLTQWLGNSVWREINFTVPYSSFSIRDFRFVKAGKSSHKVLLSASSNAVPSDRPLIVVEHSLADVVSASPLLDTPPWGIERDYAGLGSIVWLGQGDKEGLGGVMSSTREQSINIDLEMIPGPSRLDKRRTVEFLLENGTGHHTQRAVSEGGQWRIDIKLQPGPNHFRLRILDEADVSIQPNGDTRRLLALLRHITIRR